MDDFADRQPIQAIQDRAELNLAGGIDWFRWHHGSVTDPKFALVAKKAGARLGDVIAVWAFVLEKASSDADRGAIGPLDFETLDFLLGAEEGTAVRILDAMTARGLISDSRVARWEERQPKREREDDTAAERKRRQRERESRQPEPEEAKDSHVTPCHAEPHQKTPRGEESRGEKEEAPTVLAGKPASRPPDCPTQDLISLYHEHLPMLPRVEVVNDSRKRSLAARWREVVTDPDIRKATDVRAAGLDWFAWFFGHCAKSRFLTGKAKDWRADFDFLMTPSKFAKAVEGSYHKEAA